MFLGASTSGKGNKFGWIDGSEWDYDQFYPGLFMHCLNKQCNCSGFPVNGLGDCVIMDTGDTSGDWANVDCSAQLAVACMRQRKIIYLSFVQLKLNGISLYLICQIFKMFFRKLPSAELLL